MNSQIERVRLETKKKKREQAMKMREIQLAAMKMKANAHGQVRVETTAGSAVKAGGESIDDEHICSICRDGYMHQPNKVGLL